MKEHRVAFTVVTIYLWVMWILLGSIVMETFMIYPNIFRDVPTSLEETLRFMSVRAPRDFFPTLGFLSWVTGAGSVLLTWKVREARYWIIGSVLLIIVDGLVSMAFAWPRNTIMFVEGLAVHSAEMLRQTAREFQMLHWARLVLSAGGSALLFVGMMRFYRHELLSTETGSCPAPILPSVA